MPIYEYRCESCGHQFEKLVKINADAPPCEACGEAVKKLVSAAGFILKGGGWYKDHYGLKSGSSSDSSGGSTSDSGTSGGSADSGSSSTSSSSTSTSSAGTSSGSD